MRNLACYLIDYRREYFVIWLMPLVAMCLVNVSIVVDRFGVALRMLAFIAMVVSMANIIEVARHCKWEFLTVFLFTVFSLMVVPFGGMMIFHRNGTTLYSVIGTTVFCAAIDSLFTLLFALWVSETKRFVQFKKAS